MQAEEEPFKRCYLGSQKFGLGRLCDYLCEASLVDSEGRASHGGQVIIGMDSHCWTSLYGNVDCLNKLP